MGAWFEIFVRLVIASATAAFAHFGLLLEGGDGARPSAEARSVKRSVVLATPAADFVRVRR